MTGTMGHEEARVFYLRNQVIFPYSQVNVVLPLTKENRELSAQMEILVCPVTTIIDIFLPWARTGTLARIMGVDIRESGVHLKLKGIARAEMRIFRKPARSSYRLADDEEEPGYAESCEKVRRKTQELVFLLNVEGADRLIELLSLMTKPGQLSDYVAHYFILSYRKRLRLLRQIKAGRRNEIIIEELNRLIKKTAGRNAGAIAYTGEEITLRAN